ncbi:hypothetical protein F4859DRAFT_508965 [Xylaria cf. heliscus]|nr:hypothetical protein F4859DRAFT_508965 [Xylaria cf. heliscus]
MQFTTITALFGMLLASAAPALASPVAEASPVQDALVPTETPGNSICGQQFGAPIAAHPLGSACQGSDYACDSSCTDIIQCANGRFVLIASCGSAICAGNNNGGAVCG